MSAPRRLPADFRLLAYDFLLARRRRHGAFHTASNRYHDGRP